MSLVLKLRQHTLQPLVFGLAYLFFQCRGILIATPMLEQSRWFILNLVLERVRLDETSGMGDLRCLNDFCIA